MRQMGPFGDATGSVTKKLGPWMMRNVYVQLLLVFTEDRKPSIKWVQKLQNTNKQTTFYAFFSTLMVMSMKLIVK